MEEIFDMSAIFEPSEIIEASTIFETSTIVLSVASSTIQGHRSKVWLHFTIVDEKTKCKYCNKYVFLFYKYINEY